MNTVIVGESKNWYNVFDLRTEPCDSSSIEHFTGVNSITFIFFLTQLLMEGVQHGNLGLEGTSQVIKRSPLQ